MRIRLERAIPAVFLFPFLFSPQIVGAQASPLGGVQPSPLLPYPAGENLVGADAIVIGKVLTFNQVLVQVDGTFASLPFSFGGFLASNAIDAKAFDPSSLLIYYPKRDCRGAPFIKIDKVTVPYKAYPIGIEQIAGSSFFKTVEFHAPIQQAFGVARYMFSLRDLLTGLCTEGTYFGSFLEGKKLRISGQPPLFLK